MHLAGHAGRVDERAVRAGGDRDGVRADHVQDPDRVRRHLLERLVSGHGRDGHDLQLRAREREHQGHRIVVARVAVDDHRRLRHGASFKRAACSDRCHARSPPSSSAPSSFQAAPAATTGSAESITTGSAAVDRHREPEREATTYHFEYGTSDAYGLTTPDQNAGAGTDPVAVRATLSGLTSDTTYHYRVVATNATGVARR